MHVNCGTKKIRWYPYRPERNIERTQTIGRKKALLFEVVLGADSEPMMHMQTKYNLLTIKQEKSFMEHLVKLHHIAAI